MAPLDARSAAAGKQYTIDEALKGIPFGLFHYMLLALSGLGFFATTIELIMVSLVQGGLQDDFPSTREGGFGFSLLFSIVFVGDLLGTVLWAHIGDKWGRRVTFVGTSCLAAITSMLSAFAPTFELFVLCRLLLGIAIGGCLSIDVIYFVEFMPSKDRGFRTSFIILIGILACKLPLLPP